MSDSVRPIFDLQSRDLEEDSDSLDFDVRPDDLLGISEDYLRPFLLEIKRQWSHGSRIGTIYSYFDSNDVLHFHFAERGSYLQREGALEAIPTGHLPGYFVNTQANVADSKAGDAAEMMVSLPAEVDANDPQWDRVIAALAALKER